jgi:hypothetical protein
MDGLFAIDREAREQNLSLDDRHVLRQERAPALLDELHALLTEMKASGTILPQSVAGKAINYTLKRWVASALSRTRPCLLSKTDPPLL